MKKVALYSILLIAGLIGSQLLPNLGDSAHTFSKELIQLLSIFCLAFIMIRVGYEFHIDKSKLREYGKDYAIAATAAGFPWIFCCLYFVFVMTPSGAWGNWDTWRDTLLTSRFAAPTSAGLLFSMLAAAGLSTTWMFRKARILAIFDDLDTVLFMIPLKMTIVGMRWQQGVIVGFMAAMLWLAWKYLHKWRIPAGWKSVLAYAAGLAIATEAIYLGTKFIDDTFPIHIEVLLPAFVLGAMIAHPSGKKGHTEFEESHGTGEALPVADERVATWISAAFMVLVGLSMPPLSDMAQSDSAWPGWGVIGLHVLAVTVLSNLGKMFPLFCYKTEAGWKARLALCIGMFPRGEVGAGVLIVSLGYGIGGPMVTVAVLSLALNLVLTGAFIFAAKRLLRADQGVVSAEKQAA